MNRFETFDLYLESYQVEVDTWFRGQTKLAALPMRLILSRNSKNGLECDITHILGLKMLACVSNKLQCFTGTFRAKHTDMEF